jgi:hypothetical protein
VKELGRERWVGRQVTGVVERPNRVKAFGRGCTAEVVGLSTRGIEMCSKRKPSLEWSSEMEEMRVNGGSGGRIE